MDLSLIKDALQTKQPRAEKNCKGRAEVWQDFRLVYSRDKDNGETNLIPGTYCICACDRCKKVYRTGNDAYTFGTVNLKDHLRTCKQSPLLGMPVSQSYLRRRTVA